MRKLSDVYGKVDKSKRKKGSKSMQVLSEKGCDMSPDVRVNGCKVYA